MRPQCDGHDAGMMSERFGSKLLSASRPVGVVETSVAQQCKLHRRERKRERRAQWLLDSVN